MIIFIVSSVYWAASIKEMGRAGQASIKQIAIWRPTIDLGTRCAEVLVTFAPKSK